MSYLRPGRGFRCRLYRSYQNGALLSNSWLQNDRFLLDNLPHQAKNTANSGEDLSSGEVVLGR